MIVGVKKVDDGIVIYENDGGATTDITLVTPTDVRWLEALTALEYAPTPVQPVVDLPSMQAKAMDTINVVLTSVRKRFITDLPGQDMTYMRKDKEAREYLALPVEPTDLTPFPFLASEIGITASTAYQVAQVIVNLANSWAIVGSRIEAIRLRANNSVAAATTNAEVNQALNQLSADLTALLTG